MNLLLGVPSVLTLLLLTVIPVFYLDGGAAYMRFLSQHAALMSLVAFTWTAIGYWLARRIAVVLLRRAGAKVRINA